ncbi:MAG: FixH family protein [Chloroflexia bacterium]
MKHPILIAFFLLFTFLLTACGDEPFVPTSKVEGELQLTFSTDPSPPTGNYDATLRIVVKDAAGISLDGAVVEMVADMTTMHHPGVGGTLTPKGNGIYETTGKFAMGGIWRVEVVATKDGGKSTTGTFDIQVK